MFDANESFPALEERVLVRWKERDIFAETLRRREGAEPWILFEGPPTANGAPGTHHVLSRAFKDIFPRFQTMRGRFVDRRAGWDCHGLPVEIAVERQLGLSSKHDIEKYGIAEFNARCRESVFEFLAEWVALTDRIGYWIDIDRDYKTLDPDYIESVWWSLKTIFERDLLYEGFKVVPYCPRCGTALSSHELGQPGAYQDVVDQSAYVRFPLTDRHGEELIAWTTTPWTLVSNAAAAVSPDTVYVRAQADGFIAIVAEASAEKVLGANVTILDRFAGRELDGLRYDPPFSFIPASAYGERGHTVVMADFVTATDGTGVVHTAIAFGEDDFALGARYNLQVINPVLPDGTYDERITGFSGRQVKSADEDLVEDLRARGRLLRSEPYEHSYPHCWRCSTPLLYYAKPSWYIATSTIRDRMLQLNSKIEWHPDHVRDGRFGSWLEGNVDWALSRERYWGTPLPIWRCDSDLTHVHCIGSFDELEELSGVRLDDPHRPFVDNVTFPCPACSGLMDRVPEVIDVWYDSGAMPFAQHHAPFEHNDEFTENFPADYICEAQDQTRGWFYSLLAISTLVFDVAPYKDVVCLGLIADAEGKKMSKSRGNVVPPADVLDLHGADALRWYFFTSKQPWDGYRFSIDGVAEGVRSFLKQLWNTYGFYALYAEDWDQTVAGDPTDLDKWALSRLAATVDEVTDALEAFDATRGGRALAVLVDDLSNWYVRRSRRRFWEGDPAAFSTLRTCLVTVSQLLAPFCPFLADELYENLDATEPSVHLTDWPVPTERDLEIEEAMQIARETVQLGLAARGQAKLKLRQPLKEAIVVARGPERAAISRLVDVVREELNVEHIRFVSEADELGTYVLRPNYRTLGPRFGKQMPQVAAAIEGLDADHGATVLLDGGSVGVSIGGQDHALDGTEVSVALEPLSGYQLEREGSHAVALDTSIDEELRRKGWIREVVRLVQNARKDAGLDIRDRVILALSTDTELADAIRKHETYVAAEVLAVQVVLESSPDTPLQIDGHALGVRVTISREPH